MKRKKCSFEHNENIYELPSNAKYAPFRREEILKGS